MNLRGINRWVAFGSILFAFMGPMSAQPESQQEKKEMTVSHGNEVSIEYTLRLKDKQVIDTSVGSEPLTYVHGFHQIIPGLEKELEGLKIGDSKQVTVKPEEGYGFVDQEAFEEVDKEKIPQDAVKVGAQLQGQDASGKKFSVRVVEIKDKTVVLDLNHPLAGKTLYFEVKVLDIKKAPVQ